MAFNSEKAYLIWDKLYTVLIPDNLTLNSDFIRKFGTRITNDKKVDSMLSDNLTTVMIPIATILEYFNNGIQIQITNRQDLISIHKDIELYLNEWKDHITYDININVTEHKELLNSLEKLSKHIYEKAKVVEVTNNLTLKQNFGLINNYTKLNLLNESNNKTNKPDYEGISKLIKSKIVRERY